MTTMTTETKFEMDEHSLEIFTQNEFDYFLKLLSDEKEKIIKNSKKTVKGGSIEFDKNTIHDEVDLASATINQNLTFRLLDRQQRLLKEIEYAMKKIESGDYGYCEGTGLPISKRRLELRPWTRHSVKYKEKLEQGKKTGRGVHDE